MLRDGRIATCFTRRGCPLTSPVDLSGGAFSISSDANFLLIHNSLGLRYPSAQEGRIVW
jgi:hypothetical protein